MDRYVMWLPTLCVYVCVCIDLCKLNIIIDLSAIATSVAAAAAIASVRLAQATQALGLPNDCCWRTHTQTHTQTHTTTAFAAASADTIAAVLPELLCTAPLARSQASLPSAVNT